ncbi:MAG: flavin reductase family protein [Alphaproteobacteria bacterium]|nr:flavin reductase family protein [Alphaproteobacteria bacterium]
MTDKRAFRQALGTYPTGVAVVTALPADRKPMGITVNSFTSVSLEPPLVLWCMDRRSERFAAFSAAEGYVINILGTEHEEVSARLAQPGSHSLEGIGLCQTELGPPALADALAVFECAAHACHDGGDHAILVGRVLRFHRHGPGAPLVFYRGAYGALSKAAGP